MARRKYRSGGPYSSAAGSRPDEPAPESQRPLQPDEPSSPQPPATDQAEAKSEPAQHFSSGLGEQIRQQQAYAEQQRYYQQQQANPVFRYLAAIPGLSARQVHYLTAYFTSYPDKLNAEHWGTIADAHHRALAHGIAPDSDQYFQFVNGQLHQQPPSPPPMPEPRPEHVTVDIEKHEAPEDEPEESRIMPEHVSAPVSHGDYHSVEPSLSPSQVRLTPEERELCRINQIDETKYAEGKLKLAKLKASGLK